MKTTKILKFETFDLGRFSETEEETTNDWIDDVNYPEENDNFEDQYEDEDEEEIEDELWDEEGDPNEDEFGSELVEHFKIKKWNKF